jgi:putative nucleotidyltransferase with HDIG domain
MACVGEWVEVRLGLFGVFTLRPVAAFIGLWVGGPLLGLGLLMVVGLVPILIGGPVARSVAPDDDMPSDSTFFRRRVIHIAGSVVFAGTNAVGLWFGYAAYSWADLGTWLLWVPADTVRIALQAISFLAFWTVQMSTQALNLYLVEGIRLRASLRHLHEVGWRNALVLAGAAIALNYFGITFGVPYMFLAGVMLIEAYYPYKLIGEQRGILLTSLQMMAQAVDLKDPYTSNHSQRVSRYAVRLARAMGVPEQEVERIRIGGLMHDLGKIGVSGHIIRKPGKLTQDEQDKMREHSKVSADIITHLEILGESADMVRHHHENYDGTGYPDGLKGEAIPLGSRIIFVADAYDALVTDRPYRKGATREEALAVIRANAGTQFDASVVNTMERIADLL